jgi:hypothetical protein
MNAGKRAVVVQRIKMAGEVELVECRLASIVAAVGLKSANPLDPFSPQWWRVVHFFARCPVV